MERLSFVVRGYFGIGSRFFTPKTKMYKHDTRVEIATGFTAPYWKYHPLDAKRTGPLRKNHQKFEPHERKLSYPNKVHAATAEIGWEGSHCCEQCGKEGATWMQMIAIQEGDKWEPKSVSFLCDGHKHLRPSFACVPKG